MQEIVDGLQILPAKIYELEKEILNINTLILETKHKLDLWELNALSEIQSELNEANKPKFSNESLRAAELERRKTSKYQKTKTLYDNYNKDYQLKKIELNYNLNLFSMYKSLCLLSSK